jgi:hypothetical protein
MEIQKELNEIIIAEHSRLNAKEKRIDEYANLQIENDKSAISCIQCGKNSDKVKCKECAIENKNKRVEYAFFISSWAVSSILTFFASEASSAISTGLCCGAVMTNIYKCFG